MNLYFVYIIYSNSLDVYYKGYSTNPSKRLWEHCNGFSRYTSRAKDWELVFIKSFKDKKQALIYERKLKRQNRDYLLWLIDSKENEFET